MVAWKSGRVSGGKLLPDLCGSIHQLQIGLYDRGGLLPNSDCDCHKSLLLECPSSQTVVHRYRYTHSEACGHGKCATAACGSMQASQCHLILLQY